MFEMPKGIVRNAFYTPDNRGEDLDTILDCDQGEDMEMFQYKLNDEGKIILVEMKTQ